MEADHIPFLNFIIRSLKAEMSPVPHFIKRAGFLQLQINSGATTTDSTPINQKPARRRKPWAGG